MADDDIKKASLTDQLLMDLMTEGDDELSPELTQEMIKMLTADFDRTKREIRDALNAPYDPKTSAKQRVLDAAERVKQPLISYSVGKGFRSVFELVEDEPDTRKVSANGLLSVTSLASLPLINKLAHYMSSNAERYELERAIEPVSRSAILMRQTAADISSKANPFIGISSCADMGESLKRSGVTGELCAGLSDAKHGLMPLKLKDVAAGVQLSLKF